MLNRNPVTSVAARVFAAGVISWVFVHSPAEIEAQQARTLVHGEASNGGFGGIVFKGSGVNDQFAGFFACTYCSPEILQQEQGTAAGTESQDSNCGGQQEYCFDRSIGLLH